MTRNLRLGVLFVTMLVISLMNIRSTAQTVMTKRDTSYINKGTILKLKMYEDLLNAIAMSEESGDVEQLIKNAFSANRIFYDPEFTVEDDLDPDIHPGTAVRERQITDYLKDFDILYQKSEEESVKLEIQQLSSVKRADTNLYLKIYFKSVFSGKNNTNTTPYSANYRVAEIKAIRPSRKWETYIVRIGFYDPQALAGDTLNNIAVLDENEAVSIEETDEDAEELKEIERRQSLYAGLMSKANSSAELGDYAEAYKSYKEALAVRSFAPEPLARIKALQRQIEKITPDVDRYYYERFFEKGKTAEKNRQYENAKQYYMQALEKNRKEEAKINPLLKALTDKIRMKTIFEEKFKEGKYLEAKKMYEDAWEKDKQNTDYLVGMARCAEKRAENKTALKYYNQAIEQDMHNLEALIYRGAYYDNQKNYIEALADYKTYLSADKYNADVYVQRALIYEKMNNHAAAYNELDEAIKINPAAAGLYFTKGKMQYNANNYKIALDMLNTAIQKNPVHADAWFYKGLCFYNLNDISAAAEAFKEARRNDLESSNVESINNIAAGFFKYYLANKSSLAGYHNRVNADSASEMIRFAILLAPRSKKYRYERGELSMMMKNYRNAINQYTEAAELDRGYAEAYLRRAQAYMSIGFFDSARLDFGLAIKNLPPFAKGELSGVARLKTIKGQGEVNYRLGNYKGALDLFNDALAKAREYKIGISDDDRAEIHNYRGRCWFELGNDNEAKKDIKQALSIRKDYAEAFFNLSVIHYRQRYVEDALDNMFNAVTRERDHPLWNYEYGQMLRATGNYAEAAKAYKVAMNNDTTQKFPKAVYYRGVCYYHSRQYSLALHDYIHSVENSLVEPNDNIDLELGDIYFNLGRHDSAYAHYLKAYEYNNNNAMACYRLGKVSYRQRKIKETYEWFDKAFVLKDKTLTRKFINNDEEIGKLKEEPGFKDLLKKYF